MDLPIEEFKKEFRQRVKKTLSQRDDPEEVKFVLAGIIQIFAKGLHAEEATEDQLANTNAALEVVLEEMPTIGMVKH